MLPRKRSQSEAAQARADLERAKRAASRAAQAVPPTAPPGCQLSIYPIRTFLGFTISPFLSNGAIDNRVLESVPTRRSMSDETLKIYAEDPDRWNKNGLTALRSVENFYVSAPFFPRALRNEAPVVGYLRGVLLNPIMQVAEKLVGKGRITYRMEEVLESMARRNAGKTGTLEPNSLYNYVYNGVPAVLIAEYRKIGTLRRNDFFPGTHEALFDPAEYDSFPIDTSVVFDTEEPAQQILFQAERYARTFEVPLVVVTDGANAIVVEYQHREGNTDYRLPKVTWLNEDHGFARIALAILGCLVQGFKNRNAIVLTEAKEKQEVSAADLAGVQEKVPEQFMIFMPTDFNQIEPN